MKLFSRYYLSGAENRTVTLFSWVVIFIAILSETLSFFSSFVLESLGAIIDYNVGWSSQCYTDSEDIIKWSGPLSLNDGAAAFEMSEQSQLPLALSPKDLQVGNTQTLIVCGMKWIECHPVESDVNSPPECISIHENWLDWNGDIDNPNASKDNCTADVKCAMWQDIGFEDLEYREKQDVSAAPIVPGLIWHSQKAKSLAENVV